MRHVVRITKKDPETGEETSYIEEKFGHTDRSIASEWLPAAMKMENVIRAVVVSQYSETEREEFYQGFRDAVSEYGERETLKLVEDVIDSGIPVRRKVAGSEKHPGFQLISRPRQQAIHYHQDWHQMKYLARQLLSALAMMQNDKIADDPASVRDELFRPLGKGASDRIWRDVIRDIKLVLYPVPQKVETTRAERESRRLANREQRLATQPKKGMSKGGKTATK